MIQMRNAVMNHNWNQGSSWWSPRLSPGGLKPWSLNLFIYYLLLCHEYFFYYIHMSLSLRHIMCSMQAIPAWFVRMWMDPSLQSCTLVSYDTREYDYHFQCKVLWHATNMYQCALGKGWYEFVKENELAIGDRVGIMPTKERGVFHIFVIRSSSR